MIDSSRPVFSRLLSSPLLWAGIVLMGALMLTASTGYAQSDAPTVTPAVVPTVTPAGVLTAVSPISSTNAIEMTFEQLEYPTFDLIPPAVEEVSFSLPYRWRVNESNSYIDVLYDVFQSDAMVVAGVEGETAVTNDLLFMIYIDSVPVAGFSPLVGTGQTLRIAIPNGLFADPDQTDHTIQFALQRNDCTSTVQTRVIIQGGSTIHLEYDVRPTVINLADFPRPLIQDSLTPESLLFIVPDAYTDADLGLAASIAATVGSTTVNNHTILALTTPSAITPTQLSGQSVIAIGTPAQNSFIADLYRQGLLPTGLTENGEIYDIAGNLIPVEAGILQEIAAVGDDNYVYLVVTGGNDAAVARAADAVARRPEFGQRGNLSIIEARHTTGEEIDPVMPDIINLDEIGFRDTTWTGLGRHKATSYFTIPADWQISDEAAVSFSYLASNALDGDQSILRVELNGKVIGQASLEAAQEGENRATIPLPPVDLRPGETNRLAFVAELALDQPCPPPNAPQAWLRIRNDGVITLPHVVISETAVASSLRTNPDLSDVLFALPAEPASADLDSLVQLAQMLGVEASGPGFVPLVQRGVTTNTMPSEPHQVIAIGRPSANELVAAFNDQLPQPFMLEDDSIGETVGKMYYRLPPAFDLGVIQYMPAPWNPERPFIIISGTTDKGLRWSTKALASETLGGQLAGNVIFVEETPLEMVAESFNVTDINSLPGLSSASDVLPNLVQAAPTVAVTSTTTNAATPAAMLTATSVPTQTAVVDLPDKYEPPDTRPPIVDKLIPALIGAGVLLLAIGGLFTWIKSRRAKKRREAD